MTIVGDEFGKAEGQTDTVNGVSVAGHSIR